ncbi:MAG: hypothetical protein K0R78_3697 [Pelosinus sp.]|nr:hypothetical protein [Pelosinus sp.]
MLDFQREVLDRMIVLETKMDVVISGCPTCKAKVDAQEIALAKTIESNKSAHHRIDEVYKTAGYISAGIGLVLQVIAFALQNFKGGH